MVLLGHVSRLAGASQVLCELSKSIKAQGEWAYVEPAFLQFEHPTLSESIDKLVSNGVERVVVAPLFLWEGNHVHHDIPEQIKEEAQQHTGVHFVYTAALGHHPRMVDIVLDRIHEVI